MKKIAICIPTYNRNDIIEELLTKYIMDVLEFNCDVFVFDSSDNTRTYEVIKNVDYKRVFYYSVHSSIHSNEKVYMIYQNQDIVNSYDYIWIWSDSIRWKKGAIELLYNEIDEDYNLIFMHHNDKMGWGTKRYSSFEIMIEEMAGVATLYGSTLVNTLFLKNIDWKYYENKYFNENTINFSHVALIFEELFKSNELKVKHISIDSFYFVASPLKKKSGWHGEVFRMWLECWPETIIKMNLSSDRTTAIIRNENQLSGIFSLQRFWEYRKEGIFRYTIWKKYSNLWKPYTGKNKLLLLSISLTPRFIASLIYNWPDVYLRKKYKSFSRKYNNIYIYGCGANATIVAQKLMEWDYEFKGFIVTSNKFHQKSCLQHAIYECTEEIVKDQNCGIVLGLNRVNAHDVKENILNMMYVDKNRVFEGFVDYGI